MEKAWLYFSTSCGWDGAEDVNICIQVKTRRLHVCGAWLPQSGANWPHWFEKLSPHTPFILFNLSHDYPLQISG
jgi:hypothetical protein